MLQHSWIFYLQTLFQLWHQYEIPNPILQDGDMWRFVIVPSLNRIVTDPSLVACQYQYSEPNFNHRKHAKWSYLIPKIGCFRHTTKKPDFNNSCKQFYPLRKLLIKDEITRLHSQNLKKTDSVRFFEKLRREGGINDKVAIVCNHGTSFLYCHTQTSCRLKFVKGGGKGLTSDTPIQVLGDSG